MVHEKDAEGLISESSTLVSDKPSEGHHVQSSATYVLDATLAPTIEKSVPSHPPSYLVAQEPAVFLIPVLPSVSVAERSEVI